MRMRIPHLGSKFRLINTWSFWLHCEYRNKTMWNLTQVVPMQDIPWDCRKSNKTLIALPPGTMLTVDRIYIRKDQSNHDSITFKAEVQHLGVFRKVRFWVTLDDYNNNLNVEVIV